MSRFWLPPTISDLINKMNLRIMRLNQGELELDGVAHDIELSKFPATTQQSQHSQRGARGSSVSRLDKWRGYKHHHRTTLQSSLCQDVARAAADIVDRCGYRHRPNPADRAVYQRGEYPPIKWRR